MIRQADDYDSIAKRLAEILKSENRDLTPTPPAPEPDMAEKWRSFFHGQQTDYVGI